jgi:peptidoglycan/LPS O-acetylase OafA/YrhL
MFLTAHLPSQGDLWQAVRKNLVYTVAQAGGVQVDIMFMIAGYLVVAKALAKPDELQGTSLLKFTLKRAFRLAPW